MKKQKNESIDEFTRRVLLTKLAEHKGYGYDHHAVGLYDPLSKEPITNESNVVAKLLLGQMSNSQHIASSENLLRLMTKLYDYDKIVESARPLLEKYQVVLPKIQQIQSSQTGTVEWFRKMIELCD